MQGRFRGVLVSKAHRLVYQSTLGWRVIKKKREGLGQHRLVRVREGPRVEQEHRPVQGFGFRVEEREREREGERERERFMVACLWFRVQG